MATIKDVAKAAGVSASTVSLVLNGIDAVKLETRYRVLDAIKELDYQPNLYARNLVMKRSKAIGVVRSAGVVTGSVYSFDTAIDTFLLEMLRSIENGIYRKGYTLHRDWAETDEKDHTIPSIFKGKQVDGILIVGGILNSHIMQKACNASVPVVLVGARHPDFDFVDTDPVVGIDIAVNHLFSLGHRRIAFINGPDTSQSSARKIEGFARAHQKLGVEISTSLVQKGDFSGRCGYNAMAAILQADCRPTAVIAAADCMALGALRLMMEKNIRCPNDISVIGFEDGMLAEYSTPALTTICVDKEKLGEESCNVLFERLRNPNAQKMKLIFKPHLVERASVLPLS